VECVVKALKIGLELGNELLENTPHLAAMLNADPRLAARGDLEYRGSTVLRGVEIAARFRLAETSQHTALWRRYETIQS